MDQKLVWSNPEIEAAEDEIAALGKRLQELKRTIRTERLKLYKERLGIEVGSVVTVTYRGEVTEHKVDEIIDCEYGLPRLVGRKRKKDGAWGVSTQSVYGKWTVKQEPK